MGSVRTLLANRAIVRCEGSWAVAALGTWVFTIALALYAYYEHGPVGVGLAVAARMLPAALFAALPAFLERRWSRHTIVLTSALARFLVLEGVALVVWLDAPFAILLLLGGAFEIAAGLHRTVRTRLILDSARSAGDLAVLGAGRLVTSAGFLMGALLSAVLLTSVRFDVVFAAAGLVFGLVAALAWAPGARAVAAADRATSNDAPHPLREVTHARWTRLGLGLFGAGVLVQATLDLLLVVVALELVHLGDGGVGWLRAAFAGGALLIAGATTSILHTGRLALGTSIALALAGIPLALVAAWPAVAPAVVLIGLLGAGYALMDSSLELLTQRVVPPAVARSAVIVEKYAYPLARAAGAGLGTALVLGLGDRPAVVVSGLLLPAISVVTIRPLKRAENATEVPRRPLELLGRLPLFRALPPSMVENLALYARPASFTIGSRLPERDSDAETLYVIEEGQVEGLDQRGETVRFSRGACLGRSTIIHHEDGLRSLTALTPVTVWALGRADLLGSLGGAPPAVPAERQTTSAGAVSVAVPPS